MAAVLCQSFSALCQGLVFAVTCPCRVCGDTCEGAAKVLTSPFTPYLLTTLALHSPPIGWGIRAAIGVLNQHGVVRCDGDTWLWVNSGLSLVHILAAFYIVRRIQKERSNALEHARQRSPKELENGVVAGDDSDEEPWQGVDYQQFHQTNASQTQTKHVKRPTLGDKVLYTVASSTSFPTTIPGSMSWKERASRDVVLWEESGNKVDTEGEANSLQRLRQVFCYDVTVALYMLVAVFWFVWQSVGISQVLLHDRHSNSNNADNGMDDDNNNNFNYNRGDDQLGNNNNNYYYNADSAAELCDSVEYWTILSILCSFLFTMLVCVVFSCSLMCMTF